MTRLDTCCRSRPGIENRLVRAGPTSPPQMEPSIQHRATQQQQQHDVTGEEADDEEEEEDAMDELLPEVCDDASDERDQRSVSMGTLGFVDGDAASPAEEQGLQFFFRVGGFEVSTRVSVAAAPKNLPAHVRASRPPPEPRPPHAP